MANFLLAWHNAAENKGWDPTELWNVDEAIAADIITVLGLIKPIHRYRDDLGFGEESRRSGTIGVEPSPGAADLYRTSSSLATPQMTCQ